jgi:hypothetical protein
VDYFSRPTSVLHLAAEVVSLHHCWGAPATLVESILIEAHP